MSVLNSLVNSEFVCDSVDFGCHPSALPFVTSVLLSLLLTQALEEKKSAVVATQLELQAVLRRAARQEALTGAAEGQLNKLKEENNEVGVAAPPCRTEHVLC